MALHAVGGPRALGSQSTTPPYPPRPGAGARILKLNGVRMAEQLLLFANELRTRAKEILARAASTDDLEAQGIMRVVAAGYEKLARRVERRVREAREAVEA
jgi:hypothetical protein